VSKTMCTREIFEKALKGARSKIARYPHDALRAVARPVPPGELSPELLEHIRDLESALEGSDHGLALASNQVAPAAPSRIFVVSVADPERARIFGDGLVLNPTIGGIDTALPKQRMGEGCLSLVGTGANVPRHTRVSLLWETRDRKPRQEELTGALAQMAQHEVDHLDGVLYIDHLGRKERVRARTEATRNKLAGK